jgi:hypothetical protein
MTTVVVVRVGPTPLRPSRARGRLDELARIFAAPVTIAEATTVDTLAHILATQPVAAIAADAPPPGQLGEIVTLARDVPIFQPRWHTRRDAHGHPIERFAGYAQLIAGRLHDLTDGALVPPPH